MQFPEGERPPLPSPSRAMTDHLPEVEQTGKQFGQARVRGPEDFWAGRVSPNTLQKRPKLALLNSFGVSLPKGEAGASIIPPTGTGLHICNPQQRSTMQSLALWLII